MPRRQPFKARQTQPGVIPEHFRRQPGVVKASESEECCWRPAARASPAVTGSR
jgi:aminoglycoside N3'-acetyltransferase